jgi:hypothetical protein
MVITAIGYLLLALSVLAVLGFCWLTASCAGHQQRRGTSNRTRASPSTMTTGEGPSAEPPAALH